MAGARVTFSPPPYPYERLGALRDRAGTLEGGAIDCSIGTPVDPPPDEVVAELARANGARGYPPSAGTAHYREAAARWLARRCEIELSPDDVAACVGTKEFVASLAHYLHLRDGERDTVLYPEVSYPTYAMGATLAGLRPLAVPVVGGRLNVEALAPEDVRRALLVWTSSPSNPTGALDDLESLAQWGQRHGVIVASDECYNEFTWSDRPRTILEFARQGVVAVHSISKRSNLAGLRAGFYAGDPELVAYLRACRQHAGLMVPGPVQAAVAVAYEDDAHVRRQRERYAKRLAVLSEALEGSGIEAPMPAGTFYLWCRRPGVDGWTLAQELATDAGVVASPGELYGESSHEYVRIAVVQPDERIELAAARLRDSRGA